MGRLAPTASKKASEEEEDNKASAEAVAFRALRTKVESLVDFILGKKNLHTQLKNMARSTNRALTELDKLRQNPEPKKTVSSNKDGSSQTSPLFQKGKAIQENNKREVVIQFNEKFYHQIFGSAMGNPISPILSDIVMEDLEIDSISKLNFKPAFYFRYVDDIILYIPKNMIDHSVNTFNSYDENLQFTIALPQNNSISFLDTKIIVNEKQNIITDWYKKQTFSGRYLNYFSQHPLCNKIAKLNTIIKLSKDTTKICDNVNVVYKIKCKDCSASYVGQTGRTNTQKNMICKTITHLYTYIK